MDLAPRTQLSGYSCHAVLSYMLLVELGYGIEIHLIENNLKLATDMQWK